jgi:hypothetical protein
MAPAGGNHLATVWQRIRPSGVMTNYIQGFYSAWIVLFALVTVTVSATFAAAQQIVSYVYIMDANLAGERWQTYLVGCSSK